jgi:hypothetical protein
MPSLTFSSCRRHLLSLLLLLPIASRACIWDADTLSDERRARPALADLILNETPVRPDPKPFRERMAKLKAGPRENDPAWWSDLAGVHLRLGEAAEAAKILEPLVSRFPNDYGIHANLGTAYHLLGRYADAERHIARDLEINPEAHFGLEKYHLALLRYLNRDAEYQKEHVYIEAWTGSLHEGHDSAYGSLMPDEELSNKFDAQFLTATNLLEGVMYMAELNPKQPACWVMLGLLCIRHGQRDLNLGKAAFERAVRLGSPQRELLEPKIAAIDRHIREARREKYKSMSIPVSFALPAVLVVCYLLLRRKDRRAERSAG